MKILIMTIGVVFAFAFLTIIYIAVRLIFIAPITDIQVRFTKPFEVLAQGVHVDEIMRQAPPLEYEYSPTSGDAPSAIDALLGPNGQVTEGRRVYDSDPNKEVYWLKASGNSPDKIVVRSDVHSLDRDQLGVRLGSMKSPALGVLRYVGALNQSLFLVVGDPANSMYTDSRLWAVNHETYSQHEITDAPYYAFERPPKVLKPAGFNGEVLIYYVGSVDYGFGGDASRPKYSVVRVFSEAYPQGIDVAKFSFNAGTIVAGEFDGSAFVLTGDPSRPSIASQERLSPRFWRVSLPVRSP